MQNLIEQEKFECEVLDKLNSERILEPLVFCGGTMLRLGYGLERFSVDLDFWFIKKVDEKKFFEKMKNCLMKNYLIKDSVIKFYTILFEIKSKNYPRKLKIEIRKEKKKFNYEETIIYSKYSNTQILLKTVSLEDMMNFKIDAFLDRGEIRDCFDIEFLLMKGMKLNTQKEILIKLLQKIDSFKKNDYKIKLGSILEEKKRKYYVENNFKILKMKVREIIG